MHFYAWEKGLKTGMYYLRSRPAADPIKFTLDVETLLKDGGNIQIEKKRKLDLEQAEDKENQVENIEKKTKIEEKPMVCVLRKNPNSDEPCLECGS